VAREEVFGSSELAWPDEDVTPKPVKERPPAETAHPVGNEGTNEVAPCPSQGDRDHVQVEMYACQHEPSGQGPREQHDGLARYGYAGRFEDHKDKDGEVPMVAYLCDYEMFHEAVLADLRDRSGPGYTVVLQALLTSGDQLALLFVEATPDPISLVRTKGIGQALLTHGTSRANSLGLCLPR
jgi:hypothetical protein